MAARLGSVLARQLVQVDSSLCALAADAIAVAFWVAMLAGMWFFQRWARLLFAVLLAVALLTSPFRAHHYSLSPAPFSFLLSLYLCCY
jgi:hypothetical protein